MNKKSDKNGKSRVLRLIFSLVALAFLLTGIVISFFFSLMPERLRLLPLPFVIAAIAILLLLKTTNKSLDTVVPPPEEDGPDVSDETDPDTEQPVQPKNETEHTKEPDV